MVGVTWKHIDTPMVVNSSAEMLRIADPNEMSTENS